MSHAHTMSDEEEVSDEEEGDCEELPEGLVQRRAAFDIGSGATKLMIADVDVETGQLGDTAHASERTVKYAFDWKTHGVLSDAVQAEGIKVLHALRTEVLASGCTAYTAVATEVFRKAPNGAAFLQRVRETPFYRGQIVHTHVTPAAPPRYVQLSCDLAPAVGAALRASGVEQLYAHQAAAIASIVDLVVT